MAEFKIKEEHSLLEMARIGKVDNVEIMIYEGEGPIPHFHFQDKQTNRKGCIRLDCAEYFDHGIYVDRLNRKEKLKLNDWVRSFHSPFKSLNLEITVFQYMCILWGDNNPNYSVGELEIPDYTKLK